jgi:hypothetical protein
MELLGWVKETYIRPKPEISYGNETKNAHIKLETEDASLSIDVNPVINGTELKCEYLGDDAFKLLYNFEYGVGELDKENVYKKLIIPNMPTPNATANKEPAQVAKVDKLPELPRRKADRDTWIQVWRLIRPKVKNDPTLTTAELVEFVEKFEMASVRTKAVKRDTMSKIIALGKAGGIPDE